MIAVTFASSVDPVLNKLMVEKIEANDIFYLGHRVKKTYRSKCHLYSVLRGNEKLVLFE